MFYKPDGDFELKELSSEQEQAYLDYSHQSIKLSVLSVIMFMTAVILLLGAKWLSALATWMLSNITATMAAYYRTKAREAFDE